MSAPNQTRENSIPVLASVASSLGILCALLGLIVVAGTLLHITQLVQLRPNLAPMQFNTALGFVIAGGALIALHNAHARRTILAIGIFLTTLAALTNLEYLISASFGIDQLFFRAFVISDPRFPGRMSLISAVCSLLLGLSIILLSLKREWKWRNLAAGVLSSAIMSIAFLALLGYVFGLPGTYGWGQMASIAVHTAVGFALAGASVFLTAWRLSVREHERTPRWLPIPVGLGIMAGSIILSSALAQRQEQGIVRSTKAAAHDVSNLIEVRLDARMRSFVRMAQRWEFAGTQTQAAWEDDAANYVHDFPDLQALEYIDPSHKVRWIVPLAGNESKLNMDLTREQNRSEAIAQATAERAPVITHIVTLFRGGYGFVAYTPIIVKGEPQGFIAAVFNAQYCLDRYLPKGVATDEAITISEGKSTFFRRDISTPPGRKAWDIQTDCDLHGATWSIHVWPTARLVAELDSPLPAVVLCAGIIGALLMGATCLFAQRSSRRAGEARRANIALRAALDQVKTLQGLLPICSSCKRVRDDTGYWNQIDTYIHEHTNASLSHGYCPECAAKAFKDFGFEVPEKVQAELDAGRFERAPGAISFSDAA